MRHPMTEENIKKDWYKDIKFWLSKAGWPAFILLLLINFSSTLINIGSNQKDFSILKEDVKAISLAVKKVPFIETKLNNEIIPSINFLTEKLRIKSYPIKELSSLKRQLEDKKVQVALLKRGIEDKNKQLLKLKINQQMSRLSAINIRELLKYAEENTSFAQMNLAKYTDDLKDIGDRINKSPDTYKKILDDKLLNEAYEAIIEQDAVLKRTGNRLRDTITSIDGATKKLEIFSGDQRFLLESNGNLPIKVTPMETKDK
jgi:hypothetical protein